VQLSRRGDYGLRLVLELALLAPGEILPAAVISERQNIPLPFLNKIIGQLGVAGLVRTHRGASGGVALARPATEISILDVVEALEGPVLLNYCLRAPGDCTRDTMCPVYVAWGQAQAGLLEYLRGVTFDRLAEQARLLLNAQVERAERQREMAVAV